jgi:hypothetical protein
MRAPQDSAESAVDRAGARGTPGHFGQGVEEVPQVPAVGLLPGRLQDRAQQSGRILRVVGVVAGVEGAGGGVVGVVQVRHTRRRDLQQLLQCRTLGDEHLGHLAQALHVLRQRLLVLLHEGGHVTEGRAEVCQRRRQVLALARELLGDLGEAAVERPHALVVRRQRRREHLEVADRAEQVRAAVGESRDRLREVPDHPVEVLALAVEVVGADAEQP